MQSPSSSTTSSNDHALAHYRVKRFESDHTATTVPFHSDPNATEEAIIVAAKQRMEAELFAFENSFGQPTAGKS
jgi:hypothetical protein